MSAPDSNNISFGEHLSKTGHVLRSTITSGPGIAWTSLFMFLPLLSIVVISFMSRGDYGDIQLPFTLYNYQRFFGFGLLGFDPLYPFIILRSLGLAFSTTVLCILLGLPLAFFIGKLPDRYKNIALTLVMIPFWTNLLIRTYAWRIMLDPNGPVTRVARFFGLVAEGQALYPGTFAVHVGMMCDYLPYLVLPLYASVEKIDWSLAEAAMDLGASKLQMFRHAILPQITPGLGAGVILVFIPATGTFIIPDLLGGARTVMLGNAIAQQFGASRDWPFGAAISVFAMGSLMIALYLYARVSGEKDSGGKGSGGLA